MHHISVFGIDRVKGARVWKVRSGDPKYLMKWGLGLQGSEQVTLIVNTREAQVRATSLRVARLWRALVGKVCALGCSKVSDFRARSVGLHLVYLELRAIGINRIKVYTTLPKLA